MRENQPARHRTSVPRDYISLCLRTPRSRQVVVAFFIYRNTWQHIACYVQAGNRTYWIKRG